MHSRSDPGYPHNLSLGKELKRIATLTASRKDCTHALQSTYFTPKEESCGRYLKRWQVGSLVITDPNQHLPAIESKTASIVAERPPRLNGAANEIRLFTAAAERQSVQ